MNNSEEIAARAMVHCQVLITEAAHQCVKIVGGATAFTAVAAVAADCAIRWGELNKAQFLDMCGMSYDAVKRSSEGES